ncbi:MAG: trypsin-like peptidase domain-containing protein [Nitrospinales bacterium]
MAVSFIVHWTGAAAYAEEPDDRSPGSLNILVELEAAFVALAEKTRPAVVSLTPHVQPSAPVKRGSRGFRPADAGSGVIINGKEGLIVTNGHVVGNKETLLVKLLGGRKLVGQVLGVDEDTDLAVVKVDPGGPLPEVKFGDSSKLRVGQLVVAVGNPYGLSDSMSFGIISGLNRENVNLSRYEDYIQTDASINPGNSGGPLLNVRGELVGINTAVINYAQNIAFSIPSNIVKDVSSQLIKSGEVQRGWLGVGIEPVTEWIAAQSNVEEGVGVYVNDVFEGDPGYKAGLHVGDIILQVGGSPVNSSSSMIRVIGAISPGQMVRLDIIREGKRKVVPVKLGSLKKQNNQFASKRSYNLIRSLGLLVSDLQEKPGKKNEDRVKKGVMVTEVLPNGRAGRGGVERRDVITAVNGRQVESSEQFEKMIGEIPVDESMLLLVQRGSQPITLTLPGKG